MTVAAGSLLERGDDSLSRYELCLDSCLVAVVQVGVGDDGLPDYPGAALLLAQLHRPVNPFAGDALKL